MKVELVGFDLEEIEMFTRIESSYSEALDKLDKYKLDKNL